jgi:hypothetical protein
MEGVIFTTRPLYPGEVVSGTHWVWVWVGPITGLDAVDTSLHCRESVHDSFVIQSVTWSLYSKEGSLCGAIATLYWEEWISQKDIYTESQLHYTGSSMKPYFSLILDGLLQPRKWVFFLAFLWIVAALRARRQFFCHVPRKALISLKAVSLSCQLQN